MVDNCVNCREMVQRWYDEVKNYDFDKGGPKSRSGPYKHFSQMIWANSAELGVGTAVSKRYGFITVARYRPSGNEGDFAEFIKNVPPEGGTRYFFSNQLITSYFTFPRVHQPDIADLFLPVKAPCFKCHLSTTHAGAVGCEPHRFFPHNKRCEGGSLLQIRVSASSIRNKLRAIDTPTD